MSTQFIESYHPSTAMFYQGSLQEGISTAVGQQKLVLCFVTSMHRCLPLSRVFIRWITDQLPQTRMKRANNGRTTFSVIAPYATNFELCGLALTVSSCRG